LGEVSSFVLPHVSHSILGVVFLSFFPCPGFNSFPPQIPPLPFPLDGPFQLVSTQRFTFVLHLDLKQSLYNNIRAFFASLQVVPPRSPLGEGVFFPRWPSFFLGRSVMVLTFFACNRKTVLLAFHAREGFVFVHRKGIEFFLSAHRLVSHL